MSNAPGIDEAIEQFLTEGLDSNPQAIAAFAARYPQHRGELMKLLPLLAEVQQLSTPPREDDELYFDALLPDDSDFRVLRKINSGGMGIVFEGIQLSLNRRVAIKFLSSSLLQDSEQREQFEQEARLIAQLHHPNIVKVLSAHCTPQFCYYAMEYIEGKSLKEYHCKNPREAAKIGLAAAQALAYAHSCGIMHRDIKQANILIDTEGTVRVCDFGLACNMPWGIDFHEKADNRSGTLRYMAPERLQNGINSYAADQYALGASLYEYLSGHPIHQAETEQELRQSIVSSSPTLKLPKAPDLAAIINKSLHPVPEKRYHSMADMAADLQRYLNHEPLQAIHNSTFKRLCMWAKRTPSAAIFAGVASLLFLIAVAAICIGYLRTAAALEQAEQNAARAEANAKQADSILSDIFEFADAQEPTQSNARLLSTLTPYYHAITHSQHIPAEQMYHANHILARCASRSGDHATAEQAYRNMLAYGEDAATLNNLAETLVHLKQHKKAQSIYRNVVKQYSDSIDAHDRAEVVTALLALSETPDSQEYKQALQILQELAETAPDEAEYRFRYACLLAANPQHKSTLRINGSEPNALHILQELAVEYPERPEYSIELIKLVTKRLRHNKNFIKREENTVQEALLLAERLLGQFPHDPTVSDVLLQLQDTCIREYRRTGNDTEARKLTERRLSVPEVLFYHPDTPNDARIKLLELQFERLTLLYKAGKTAAANELQKRIQAELPYMDKDVRAQLQKKLNSIQQISE